MKTVTARRPPPSAAAPRFFYLATAAFPSLSLYTISQVSFGTSSPEILQSANTLHNAQGFLPR